MLSEENTAKRESESMALLQKLIRIDSKDCNFHFRDQFRKSINFKVSYPQTNIENNSNEALLRQFWHHVYAHYFKKIQQEETRRLQYVKSVFVPSDMDIESGSQLPHSFLVQNPGFYGVMNEILSPSYISKLNRDLKTDHEMDLWLKTLYLQTISLELSQKMCKEKKRKSKIIYSKLKQNRRRRQLLKNKKLVNQTLKKDREQLYGFIQELQTIRHDHMSEIEREIYSLQRQLGQIQTESAQMVYQISDKIVEQSQECESRTYSRNLMYGSSQRQLNSSKDLECLQYLIDSLQEKQIAESVAKIISTQRANGEIMFQLSYEKAMNLQPKLVTQKELQRTNFLRETSLVQFYRTGVKSIYSYICHNYVGFRELMQNRLNITARMKDKCMVQMMKKGACLASLGQIQHQMVKFNMCHHCKFLFEDHLLFTCKFASDKQSIPKMNVEASCDPNLSQAFLQGPHRNRTSQRFMTRKKNCLTSYAKIHDEYVCGRKYCFSCLKDTYSHQNIKQNGLCPFCLGVCVCTRCLRNQKIAKFKNMYTILGGDLTKIQEKSNLEQLVIKAEQPVQRGRGRPKKYAISHIAINSIQKKLRRFDEKENLNQPNLVLIGKVKRKSLLCNHWKKNDSGGNETQQEFDVRRKLKRGVGRPRLSKFHGIAKKRKYVQYN